MPDVDTASLKIYIADDHAMVREGLKALIAKKAPEWSVVGEADNGRDAVRDIRSLNPEIVLMDVSMPKLNGVEAVRTVVARKPETKVIVLSMHGSQKVVSKMLAAGAMGYLLKSSAPDEIIDAITSVGKGKVFLGTGIANIVLDDYRRLQRDDNVDTSTVLTSRQREILRLISEGYGTREIAKQIHLSPKTVESHRRALMNKLELNNVADLTKYAIRQGITSIDS